MIRDRVHRYRVQVRTIGTQKPTWRWHEIAAESPALAASEAVTLNCGLGGLGRVEVVEVVELGDPTGTTAG